MIKEPYELSAWEDVVVPAQGEVPEYFNEKKIAIIGSHDFDAPLRAHNVTLKENINGEKTLTFNMLRKIKNENGELVDNPLVKLLSNERKLKLRDGEAYPSLEALTVEYPLATPIETTITLSDSNWEDTDERWYDFVIKNIDEDKSTFLNTYTAKELFVNELGKNGWAVTLDTELENNFGTIKELGANVLEGSDWTISADSYSPTEKIAEPLFKTTLTTQLSGTYVLSRTPVTLDAGKIIYPLYNSVEWDSVNSIWKFKDGEVQFLYADKEFTLDDADDNRIIIDNTLAFNITTETATVGASIILTGASQTEALQGYRIIKTQDNRYESVLDQYVKEFEVNNVDSGAPIGTKVYGYTKTDYITPTLLKNLLTNYSNFTATTAWSGSEVATRLFPLPTSGTPVDWLNTRIFSYLALDCSSTKGYLNEGPQFAKLALIKDNVYVLRMKARWVAKNTTKEITNISSTNLATIKASIRKEGSTSELSSVRTITTTSLNTASDMATKGYALANTDARTPYSVGATNVYRDANQYIYVYLIATETTDVETDNLRLYLTNTTNNTTHDFCIEDIQLFEYKEDGAGVPIFFGDIPEATIKETPMFYQIVNEEAQFLSSNTSYYTPLYKSNYESVRSISIKESNYFNNIQSLAELFEVWVRFKTYHTQDGKLLFVNGLPKKEVIFSQFAPNGETINQAGFKYGVNLQSIKRTVDSDSIATKVIVKNNNQQYAVDGMASISRAHSNPSGENEIYNFNYYINQGLLEYNQVLADLYGLTSTDLAFLVKLRQYNDEYNSQSKLVISYSNELMLSESEITLYQTQIASIDDELLYLTNLMESYAETDDNYQTAKIAAEQMTAKKQAYQLALNATQSRYNAYKVLYDAAQVTAEAARTSKQTLKLQFYKKYYRFIQEGTWTDEKYVDDELYFLDAMKVAGVSSFPKVSYSIGVLDISKATGYEGYAFKIGQRTYVEDPEFFGYIYKTVNGLGGNIKTPFRQEVIIAEHSRNFDDASKSTITIKNYKNQFEELFQKITATTQALQYESGAYGRAAAAVMPSGEIDISTLEKSFSNNAFILSNSNNQNVIWDSSIGIEIINNENSSERLRLVAGGIFLSTDAGKTWKSGITGTGINTRYLLAGQIDTSKITIVNGTVPYFRWDKDGLNAFSVSGSSYDLTKFVRFNQYGLFGTDTGNDLIVALNAATTFEEKLTAIKENSHFALTWDGLYLSSTSGNLVLDGDLLAVYDNSDIMRAGFGRFVETESAPAYYGLRLFNATGDLTLTGDSVGNLWLQNLLSIGSVAPISLSTQSNEDIIITRANGVLTFSIPLSSDILAEGQLTCNYETISKSYLYDTSDYTDDTTNRNFLIPETSFDVDLTNKIVSGNTYNISYYADLRTTAYRYLGINGTLPTFLEEDPIVLYAGHTDPVLAPLRIFSSGHLSAIGVDITGEINATLGTFSGRIQVGQQTPVYRNLINGLDGSANAPYAIWCGTPDTEGGVPVFYVTPTGELHATNAIIEGTGKFTGEVIAESGSFTGEIKADSGLFLGQLFFKDATSNSYIGYSELTDVYININNDAFQVTDDGNIYGSIAYLGYNALWATKIREERYNVVVGSANGFIFKIFDPSVAASQNVVFGIDTDGNVYLSGTLKANNATLTDTLMVGSIRLDGGTGSIYSTELNNSSNYWWSINGDGTARFRNIEVRGTIQSTVFEYNRVSSVGGSLLISPSICLISDITLANDAYDLISSNNITDSEQQEVWANINQVRVELPDGAVINEVSVSIETSGETITKIKVAKTGLNNGVIVTLPNPLPVGTILMSTSTSVNSILLNAQQKDGPIILMQGISDGNNATVLIGNLTGAPLPTEYFGALTGYGLYADNVYLTGKLYLPNAGITNSNEVYDGTNIQVETPNQQVRIWAGTSPDNKTNAPFVVTHDGTLYASKGVFRGTIEASGHSIFNGTLGVAGITISSSNITDNFYVAYEFETEEPTIDDLIMKIDYRGLNIWDGGLNIFSDYYSGWRNSAHSTTIDQYYGYGTGYTDTPYPIMGASDNSTLENYIPHITMTALHTWKQSGSFINTARTMPGYIEFSQYTIGTVTGAERIDKFKVIDNNAFSQAALLKIGIITVNNVTKYGLQSSNDIVFANNAVEALVVSPKGTAGANTSKTTVKNTFSFDNTVDVEIGTDRIVFTYVGTV